MLRAITASREGDLIVVLFMPAIVTDAEAVAHAMAEELRAAPAALVVWLGSEADEAVLQLRRSGLPVLSDPHRAAAALAAWVAD